MFLATRWWARCVMPVSRWSAAPRRWRSDRARLAAWVAMPGEEAYAVVTVTDVVAGEQLAGQQYAGRSSGQVMDGRWGRAVEQQRADREAADAEVSAGGFGAGELRAHEPVQVRNVDLVEVGPG